MDTMSAWPLARMRSATAGSLMRLVAMTGTRTAALSFSVTHAKPARGTMVAMVGMRASCQPMPVLISVTPALSSSRASQSVSSSVLPSSIRSSIESRKIRMKSAPTAARVSRTMRSATRQRWANSPPQSSRRWLERRTRN